MEWLAAVRVDVEKVAFPPLSGTVLSGLPPSEKVTVPAALEGAIVAVKVTGCPTTDGFRLDVRVLVVLALFTVWDSAVDVLPVKLPSPP